MLFLRLDINFLHLQVDDLLGSVEKIDIEVRSLETCAYNSQTFRDVLGKVQRAVDELNLHSYSNLPQWVATLDLHVSISSKFIRRCKSSLEVY